jgi:S1-C subfamily serine protease
MSNSLKTLSDQLADAAATLGASVVQVQGRRRPISGLVYAQDVVVTTARALGRDDRASVKTPDGRTIEAELVGLDPATHLVVLKVPGLEAPPVVVSEAPARVGHLAIAVARSWSNALTASVGIVSVIGGPMPTGRGATIAEVIRTSAPMHDGFSGGAFADVSGRLVGVTTAMAIRGLGVVIPASIAWSAAKGVLEHGGTKRAFLGIAGQPVRLPRSQREKSGRDEAVLVVGVSAESPAEAAGVLVGDLLVEFDGRAIESPEQLLDVLRADLVGKPVPLGIVRGGAAHTVSVVIGERPAR